MGGEGGKAECAAMALVRVCDTVDTRILLSDGVKLRVGSIVMRGLITGLFF